MSGSRLTAPASPERIAADEQMRRLYEEQRLTFDAISERMGLTRKRVRDRIKDARRRLREAEYAGTA